MMRRLIIALCLLALAGMALAEAAPARTVYADQGGVRVFAESGRAGLMNAAGEVILPAEYDAIEPFGESDCAVLHRLEASGGEERGVVRRDGRIVVPCEWMAVNLYPGVGLAACWNDFEHQHVFDLAAGGEWRALGPNVAFDADDHYIYMLRYGEAGFGYEPPFHTDVCDANRQPVFSADAWFVRGFGPDYAILQYDDGSYGVMDTAGRTVIDGLCDPPLMDGHSWAYEEPRSGSIHYVRAVKNPLNGLLKPLKLDRRHARYYLSLLGLDPDNGPGEAALRVYDDRRVCGLADPDGHRLFEIPGVALYGPDDAGLYRVQVSGYSGLVLPTDRWGYVDTAGEFVLEPKYSQAYPFVDGAAVVVEDGKWRLIDVDGRTLAEWDWAPDSWDMTGLGLPVIAVPAEGGWRVIDRRGNYVTDEVFKDVASTFGNQLMLTDRDGNFCLMDGAGEITLRAPAEEWSFYSGDPEAVWIMRDGLWGRMAATGERAGEWLIPPEYADQDRLDGGCFCLNKPDGTAVYADAGGAILGPAPVYGNDGW